ncbi:MAG: alpha-amylase [Candidatus Marinimicrobia bacterium]|nr:alpha-amylase [Candidatus Neomarinimicrobiota bacterium]
MKKKINNNLIISYYARKKYNLATEGFQNTNRLYFDSLYDIREFVEKLNSKRNILEFPEKAVHTGDIYGMSLIQDIFHYMLQKYEKSNPDTVADALKHLQSKLTKKELEETFVLYAAEFPNNDIFNNYISPSAFIKSKSKIPDETIKIIKELANIYLYNTNPAFSEYSELFDDKKLSLMTQYREVWNSLFEFFESRAPFGPMNQNLLEMLATPAREVPHSIQGQLEWIRNNWGEFLDDYLYKILISLDLIAEEQKHQMVGFGGPGPAYEHRFDNIDHDLEYEKFSHDLDWMPKVVILAKNTHVWLDQLSQKYHQKIQYLNEIPDAELDELQHRGMTSLWLIGLWERSQASKRIKQMMGNKDAVASAYSLLDYSIAEELGGHKAYMDLKKKAIKRGIRLCGDMVPNHVGIDANWVINHPEWFISSDHPPFPSYTFSGENLCNDDRVCIYLEDHYFDKSDAAVVFKRTDHHTGDVRYIYHGNDGTSMPWNDTAQLNYMKAEVREAVIQTILHVARNFDVIRFDAAMTLAKKHYQRLWFPKPGTGGDIPSRAEYAMTREEFDSFYPVEFWREVVDRVKEEEPDTLLLAEAFWMMEGYFVRTLGMHRVYNSAFMNMLKNEDNEKYRNTIKNVLEFNPEILKRYVNFMNNPDEDTANVQFGDGDKYFGVCLMMVTMPGLPMFGHGQVEGFREKYGMEFKRAYWNETENEYLVKRHQKEIFPLLHKRYLFSEVRNFHFYDYISNGQVNQNVFAYSNSLGHEKALIFYNNAYAQTSGWIKDSVASRNGDGGLTHTTLGQALALGNSDRHFTIFKDQVSGLEYIRSSKNIYDQGIFTMLNGFEYHAFISFHEVEDYDGLYDEVNKFLNGRGVPSIESAIQQVLVKPVHVALKKNYNAVLMFDFFNETTLHKNLELYKQNHIDFLNSIKIFMETTNAVSTAEMEFTKTLDNYIFINSGKPPQLSEIKYLFDLQMKSEENQLVFYSWLLFHGTGKIFTKGNWERRSRSLLDEMYFNKLVDEMIAETSIVPKGNLNDIISILTEYQYWFEKVKDSDQSLKTLMRTFISDFNVRSFIHINRYNDILWYNRETLDLLVDWLKIMGCFNIIKENYPSLTNIKTDFEELERIVKKVKAASDNSEYKIEEFLNNLE